jgi:exodeoxyribonuclease V alpha subunit
MAEASSQLEREVLAGVVERVTFHNAENGFSVLRVKAQSHWEKLTFRYGDKYGAEWIR